MILKRWMFIFVVCLSVMLFFVAGTLIGYSYCEKSLNNIPQRNDNEIRHPSEKLDKTKLVVERIFDKQAGKLKAKIRVPSIPAITKAKSYKAKIL